jgi:hypothetical protein
MADDDKPPVTGGDGGEDKDSGAKKALESERAARRKAEQDAKAARDELAKIQSDMAAGKTDAERTAQMLAELRERADASDMRALRAEVAQSKGLTPAQAKRLQGKTVEELEADADELLAAFKPVDGAGEGAATDAGTGRRGTGRPTEALKPGATPPADQGSTEFDSSKFLAAVPR